jgi:hypothetical protein
MVADPGEYVGEPGARIDVVYLGGDDQRARGCRPLAAAIRAGEHSRLPAQSDPTQRALGGIVGQADPAIIDEAPLQTEGTHRTNHRQAQAVQTRSQALRQDRHQLLSHHQFRVQADAGQICPHYLASIQSQMHGCFPVSTNRNQVHYFTTN